MQQPFAFAKTLVPYKRVLGVLVRPTCVSLSVSNPYLSLAEPVGAVLLRDGRVPQRVLAKLLAPWAGELAGVLYGCETIPQHLAALQDPHVAGAIRQIQDVVSQVQPHKAGPAVEGWWDRWSADQAASCRIDIASSTVGPSAAAAALASTSVPSSPAPAVAAVVANSVYAPAATIRADSSTSGAGGVAPAGGRAPQCSMGTLFLQHYLDALGGLNTFG